MLWNSYQEKIFDWALNGEGNAIVGAVAGSGKTTTIEETIKRLGFGQILYTVFNRHNRDSAVKKFGSIATIKTIHQLGYAMIVRETGIKRLNLNEYKYWDLAEEITSKQDWEDAGAARLAKLSLLKLFGMARLTLTPMDNEFDIYMLADKYGIDIEQWMIPGLLQLLEYGVNQTKTSGDIDFDDMIFMPVFLEAVAEKYDFVLVDEAQDLSNCQRKVVMEHLGPDSRIIAVGDEFQSIYGFAGANPESYLRMKTDTNAAELMLSVCYRCPKSHLRLAQELVPHIEWAPNAKEGTILYKSEKDLPSIAQGQDLILARTTAPLIRGCIRLIRNRIPATVRGRDIGAQIVSAIKKASKDRIYTEEGFYGQFMADLEKYHEIERKKILARRGSELALQSLQDKVDCVLEILDETNATSTETMIKFLSDMFSDKMSFINFSTIHRAKGLEADRILIMEPSKMTLSWKGQTKEQAQQEQNAKYVGLTRSKDVLIFLEGEAKEELPF